MKKRAIIATAIICLSLAAAPYVKNLFVFNTFSVSSWLGMNLFNMNTQFVGTNDIENMILKGEMTPLARIKPFSNPTEYYAYYERKPSTGIRVLDDFEKSAGGYNYNNIIYIDASKEYLKNAIVLMKKYPQYYIKGVANAMYIYFIDAQYCYFNNWQNCYRINTPALDYKIVLYIKFFIIPLLFFTVYMLAALSPGVQSILLMRRGVTECTDTVSMVAGVFIAFNLIYAIVVANFFTMGESNMYRIPFDPVILAGFGIFLDRFLKRRVNKEFISNNT